MNSKFLHQRKDFKSLISTLSAGTSILDALIEKDYWIMHVLYGMKGPVQDYKLILSPEKAFRVGNFGNQEKKIYLKKALDCSKALA